jgi:hypothetical protein
MILNTVMFAFSSIMVGIGAYIMGKFGERRRILLIIKKYVWEKAFDIKALESVERLIDEI